MWKNIVQPERPQQTIRRMRISRWVPKATDTNSEYVAFYCSSGCTNAPQYSVQRSLPVLQHQRTDSQTEKPTDASPKKIPNSHMVVVITTLQ